jgi:hypothetical protein
MRQHLDGSNVDAPKPDIVIADAFLSKLPQMQYALAGGAVDGISYWPEALDLGLASDDRSAEDE